MCIFEVYVFLKSSHVNMDIAKYFKQMVCIFLYPMIIFMQTYIGIPFII